MSECASDHKIWHAIFGTGIPTKPTYLPKTKLARYFKIYCFHNMH